MSHRTFYKTGKKDTLGKLDATLWRWFSRYIRLRDCSSLGLYKCISCGNIYAIHHSGDAGHFCKRRHKGTKFNEQNVNCQCEDCNRWNDGREWEHGQGIDKKYGKGTAEKLKGLAGMPCKLDREWYKVSIEEYKQKAKDEAAAKGITLW